MFLINVHVHVGNGEFNALRNQGYTRPLSILKIRSIVRSKYARKRMIQMMSSKGYKNPKRQLCVQVYIRKSTCTYTCSSSGWKK